MGRYDWPQPAHRMDDPDARGRHLARFRPGVDPTTAPAQPRVALRAGTRIIAKDESTGDHNLWFPIGPSITVNGQATGTPNVSGRFRDLQVEPRTGRRIYAASAGGGVWFSGDSGDSWRPLDDWQASARGSVGDISNALSCGAIYVDWDPDAAATDGAHDVVWVGTGEPSLAFGRPWARGGGTPGLPGGMVSGIGLLTATGPATGGTWSVLPIEESPTVPGWSPSLRGHGAYRIVGDPARPGRIVAATTNGLYLTNGTDGWRRITGWLSAPSTIPPPPASRPRPADPQPLDLVLTRPTASTLRIWVVSTSELWFAESAGAAPAAVDPTTLAFHRIDLGGVVGDYLSGTRLVLAASNDGATLYVLGTRKAIAADHRTAPLAQLWSVNAGAATPTATQISGLPPDLFGTQVDYDMCAAVHPAHSDRVYVGGSYVAAAGTYDAGIFLCTITATTASAAPIGRGVHADDHVFRIGPVGPDGTKRIVWVGCDGGLFRSTADGDQGTFIARNNGLAVLQPGYVASHPTNPGIVGAGFQDNGTQVRVGDSVWEEKQQGDGGGMVYDPAGANRYLRQYIQASWRASDGGTNPVLRIGLVTNADGSQTYGPTEKPENDVALFYSGADATQFAGLTHLAFGTNRVWYSSDWGRTWMTLPSASDPRGGATVDLTRDVLDPDSTPLTDGGTSSPTEITVTPVDKGILAVKFAHVPEPAPAGAKLRVLVLLQSGLVWLEGVKSGTAVAWTPIPAGGTPTTQRFREPNGSGETTAFQNGAPLSFLPARGLVSDVAVHDPTAGALGSCYVTTIGDTDLTTSKRDTLYFFDGDGHWVPCGLRVATPQGTWDPATARVTAPALGVVVDPADPAQVYVGTSVGVMWGTLVITTAAGGAKTYHWTWRQFMNGLPEAAVQDLSIRRFGATGQVRLLRAALQSRGVWETDLANVVSNPLTYLRAYPSDTRRLLPTPPSGDPVSAGEPAPVRWDDSPDIAVDETGAPSTPTEADVLQLTRAQVAGSHARARLTGRSPVIHVLVHHRWRVAAAAADVRVALLRHPLTDGTPVPLEGVWDTLVAAVGSAVPPTPLPGDWRPAGSVLWQPLGGDVDVRTPRTVSFPLDLTADAAGSTFVLLAVVLSGSNQINAADAFVTATSTAATTVEQLVFNTAHAAAKSVELGP